MRDGDDWLLAPDNGLLMPLLHRTPDAEVFRVDWRPERLSASFHGRDLFAPLAAHICSGCLPAATPIARDSLVGADWPSQGHVICHVDAFGNLITGVDADQVPPGHRLLAAGRCVPSARTFSDVPVGEAFWYRNAFDLVELAVNQGRADVSLGLGIGDAVAFTAD
jgi:hypothetical protein